MSLEYFVCSKWKIAVGAILLCDSVKKNKKTISVEFKTSSFDQTKNE